MSQGTIRFSAPHAVVNAAAFVSALAVSVAPAVAHTVDASERAYGNVSSVGGMFTGSATEVMWIATAKNAAGEKFTGEDKRRSRAKREALESCRLVSSKSNRKSCHITSVKREELISIGNGGDPPAR